MMVRRVLSALFIFLMMLTAISTASAAKDDDKSDKKSFAERTSGMVQIKDVRYSKGRGTVRVVLDITRSVDYKIMYLDNPARMVLDIQDAWLNSGVKKSIDIDSSVASSIRVGQFNDSTVRIVINTSAENNIFELDGGPAGRRLVIDLGTPEPEPIKPSKPSEKPSTNDPPWFDKPVRETPIDEPIDEPVDEPIEEPEDITRVPDGVPTLEPVEVDEPFQLPKELEDKEKAKEREKELEKERREREKQEKRERKEQERLEKEREKEQERLEKEREKEQERLEKERKAQEKRDKNKDKNKDKDKEKEIETDDGDGPYSEEELNRRLQRMTDLTGRKIAIDPGHGGNDAGAIGPSGVMEKTVTLRVALELEKLLKEEGAEVIMTRREDVEVSPKGKAASAVEELKARCEVANVAEAEIFISIHADSFTNPNARGTTGYYYSLGSPKSRRLADLIRTALIEQIRTPSRGTQPCNFYVVRNTDMPATLIELAFISNPDEEKLLNSKEGIRKAAQGILDGIEDYFG